MILRIHELLSYSRISEHFMESEGRYRVQKSLSLVPLLSQINPFHTPYPGSLRSILILSSHLRLCLPSGLFPSGFFTKILYAYLSPNACYMPCPLHPPWLHQFSYTWLRVQVMKFFIVQLSPTSYHFSFLRSKYSPQHSVLKDLHCMYLP
jgi:hypothetical protein